jgi:hypothetical protein
MLAGIFMPSAQATLFTMTDVGIYTVSGSPLPCGAVPSATNPPTFDVVSGQAGPYLSSTSSFSCLPPGWVSMTGGNGMAATAIANSAIGPLGIGASASTSGGGAGYIGTYYNSFQAAAYATASWTNTVTPLGGTGDGFIQFNFSTGSGPDGGGWRAEFNSNNNPFGLLPIVYGQSYSLDLSATAPILDAYGAEGSFGSITVQSVTLYDASGNVIPDGSLAVAPEPASVALLLTAIFGVCLFVRQRARA